MSQLLQAIQFESLDEATQVLRRAGHEQIAAEIFDDGGEEPRGLLSVVPQDRLPEEVFYGLFDQKLGRLVEVERISYSGYGPPSESHDYMGFAHSRTAYVLKGRRLEVEIENCRWGACDIHHLEAQVLDGEHPLDRDDLAQRLKLRSDWQFENLFNLILEGRVGAQEIDRLIHLGVH